MSKFVRNFAAASETETIVFGAAKPMNQHIPEWINFMQDQQIQRVCCLLSAKQLAHYSDDLLEQYRIAFGSDAISWEPIADFQWIEVAALRDRILPFLCAADDQQMRVVVHCAGGIGRTGQVLAAWLVHRRGFSTQDAIATIKRMGRNPHEAAIVAILKGQNPWNAFGILSERLDICRS